MSLLLNTAKCLYMTLIYLKAPKEISFSMVFKRKTISQEFFSENKAEEKKSKKKNLKKK